MAPLNLHRHEAGFPAKSPAVLTLCFAGMHVSGVVIFAAIIEEYFSA